MSKKNGYTDLGYVDIARSAADYFQAKYPEVRGYELTDPKKVPKFMRDILSRVVEVTPPSDTVPGLRFKTSWRFFLGDSYWYFVINAELTYVIAVFMRDKGRQRWPSKVALKKIRRDFRLMNSREGEYKKRMKRWVRPEN